VAKVVLPLEVARAFADGVTDHDVEARDVRALVNALEARFPGIAERLSRGTAVAVDGEIYQDWFLEEVRPDSDVRFLPAIEGG
jgi:molybdopterin converting factor small subunit